MVHMEQILKEQSSIAVEASKQRCPQDGGRLVTSFHSRAQVLWPLQMVFPEARDRSEISSKVLRLLPDLHI